MGMTTWTVECGACQQSYEQTAGPGPTICGACGSRRIRVVQHIEVFDNREPVNDALDPDDVPKYPHMGTLISERERRMISADGP